MGPGPETSAVSPGRTSGDFLDSLHDGGKWLADRRFLEREGVGNPIDLVGTDDDVSREGAVDAVPHAPAILAEDEVARAAVCARPAGDGGRAEDGHPLADRYVSDARPDFHHGARELVPEDDGRIVAEGVVHDVEVGAADAAVCDLHFHLRVTAARLLDVENVQVAFTGRVLDQRLHASRDSSGNVDGLGSPFSWFDHDRRAEEEQNEQGDRK